MADRRYSSANWQRVRKQILARDRHECQIRAPGCLGRANSVHHILASSTHPHLFWQPTNLEAACSRCNYSDGGRLRAENREHLHDTIAAQQTTIDELRQRLDYYENPGEPAPAKNPAKPAIY